MQVSPQLAMTPFANENHHERLRSPEIQLRNLIVISKATHQLANMQAAKELDKKTTSNPLTIKFGQQRIKVNILGQAFGWKLKVKLIPNQSQIGLCFSQTHP